MPRLKASFIVGKLVTLLISFLLILVLGEWLFPKFLDKLPLRLYGSIDKNLRILAQSSKKSIFPHEYIAIVGDSIAVGSGDWLEEVRKNSFLGSPRYSPAHLINEKTGIDVVSFAQGGVGSFGGIWKGPITQFLYINSVKNYQLSPPKYLLIFFSEGNDVYDNIQFVNENLRATEKEIGKVYEVNRFHGFLKAEFEKVVNRKFDRSFWKDMLFTRSIFQGTSNLFKEWASLKKISKENNSYHQSIYKGGVAVTLTDGEKVELNVALMNGKKTGLPSHLQAPPLFGYTDFEKKIGLRNESLAGAIEVFKQSLLNLNKFFPQSEIKIVFIPSTLSSYKIISSNVHYRGFMQSLNIIETATIEKSHTRLCGAIKQIAVNHNFSFINVTKSIRLAASFEFMHGPIDWDHFNKRGYQVLSDELVRLFPHTEQGIRIDNCVY